MGAWDEVMTAASAAYDGIGDERADDGHDDAYHDL
jgi:hypothetical protein